jgi:hypothetical protein
MELRLGLKIVIGYLTNDMCTAPQNGFEPKKRIISLGLMIQSSVPTPPSVKDLRLVASIERLKQYLSITDWTRVREHLRDLKGHAKKDGVRGSWRFNFGWAEMNVGNAREFDGVPLDNEGKSYPRVAHIQHVGGHKAAFVLLTFTRLLDIVFDYFDSKECFNQRKGVNLIAVIKEQLRPLRFPLQVQGTELSSYLQLGLPGVSTACSCMSRLSVMMFEPKKEQEMEDKFSCAERVFLHIDRKDLECIQFVVAICYKIPEDAFCTVSIRKDHANTRASTTTPVWETGTTI